MVARVTESEVRLLTQEPATTDVSLAIMFANTVVDEELSAGGASAATLKNIELLLAAHFVLIQQENGPLAKKMVGEANEGYHDVYKAGFLSTRFGQQAVALDTTNRLSELTSQAENSNRRTALFNVIGPSVDTSNDI